jgi:5-formyltetrahydrofolate cyclo-ligase
VQRPLEEVRANVRADIASIDPEDRIVQAEEIERRLLEHPAVRDAERMLCFYSAGENGVPTLPMIQRLVEFQGRRAFLPFFLGGDPAGEIKITEWQPSAPVILTPYIGAQPRYSRSVSPQEIEVALVPGLSFDSQGRRLGFGDGHFDRLLALLPEATPLIGLAFSVQVVAQVEEGAGAARMTAVVTERDVIDCSETD